MYDNFEGLIPSGNNFPKENKDWRDYTLRELQSLPNAKVIQENGKTTIQVRNQDVTFRADIQVGFGVNRSMSSMPRRTPENRDAFDAEVIRRLKNGETQAQVALTMGISQSLVSQIKQKYLG